MRVLLVEDEVRLAQAIARGLIAEGFTVDIEHDDVDGFWRAREGRYDTVVLDLLLARLNGYLITERLRGENVWTPIPMLTAKDGEHGVRAREGASAAPRAARRSGLRRPACRPGRTGVPTRPAARQRSETR